MWISLSISLNCRYILHKTYTGVDGTTLFGANAEVVATRAAAAKISFTMLGNLEDKVVRYWQPAKAFWLKNTYSIAHSWE